MLNLLYLMVISIFYELSGKQMMERFTSLSAFIYVSARVVEEDN